MKEIERDGIDGYDFTFYLAADLKFLWLVRIFFFLIFLLNLSRNDRILDSGDEKWRKILLSLLLGEYSRNRSIDLEMAHYAGF